MDLGCVGEVYDLSVNSDTILSVHCSLRAGMAHVSLVTWSDLFLIILPYLALTSIIVQISQISFHYRPSLKFTQAQVILRGRH